MCVACLVVWLFCFYAAFVGLMLGFMLMVFDILNRFT